MCSFSVRFQFLEMGKELGSRRDAEGEPATFLSRIHARSRALLLFPSWHCVRASGAGGARQAHRIPLRDDYIAVINVPHFIGHPPGTGLPGIRAG